MIVNKNFYPANNTHYIERKRSDKNWLLYLPSSWKLVPILRHSSVLVPRVETIQFSKHLLKYEKKKYSPCTFVSYLFVHSWVEVSAFIIIVMWYCFLLHVLQRHMTFSSSLPHLKIILPPIYNILLHFSLPYSTLLFAVVEEGERELCAYKTQTTKTKDKPDFFSFHINYEFFSCHGSCFNPSFRRHLYIYNVIISLHNIKHMRISLVSIKTRAPHYVIEEGVLSCLPEEELTIFQQ